MVTTDGCCASLAPCPLRVVWQRSFQVGFQLMRNIGEYRACVVVHKIATVGYVALLWLMLLFVP